MRELKEEVEILAAYLPQQLSEDEIREIARTAVQKTGAAGPKGLGLVMKELAPQIKGIADGKVVNDIVRQLLA
ncbi:MAG: GatB/YqeY domain-containing protein [Bacillota bacterium]